MARSAKGLKGQHCITDWCMGRKRDGAQKLMPSSATGLNGQRWMTYWHMGKTQNGSWANSLAQKLIKLMKLMKEALKVSTVWHMGRKRNPEPTAWHRNVLRTGSAMELWELAWQLKPWGPTQPLMYCGIFTIISGRLYILLEGRSVKDSYCLMRSRKWNIAISTIVSWGLSVYKMLCVDGVREEWESVPTKSTRGSTRAQERTMDTA